MVQKQHRHIVLSSSLLDLYTVFPISLSEISFSQLIYYQVKTKISFDFKSRDLVYHIIFMALSQLQYLNLKYISATVFEFSPK